MNKQYPHTEKNEGNLDIAEWETHTRVENAFRKHIEQNIFSKISKNHTNYTPKNITQPQRKKSDKIMKKVGQGDP